MTCSCTGYILTENIILQVKISHSKLAVHVLVIFFGVRDDANLPPTRDCKMYVAYVHTSCILPSSSKQYFMNLAMFGV